MIEDEIKSGKTNKASRFIFYDVEYDDYEREQIAILNKEIS